MATTNNKNNSNNSNKNNNYNSNYKTFIKFYDRCRTFLFGACVGALITIAIIL